MKFKISSWNATRLASAIFETIQGRVLPPVGTTTEGLIKELAEEIQIAIDSVEVVTEIHKD